MMFRVTMKLAALPLAMLASPASLTAQMSTPEMPGMTAEMPAIPAVPAVPVSPSIPPILPPSGGGMMEQGGIHWAPLSQVSPPAPQATYPPCTREVQDECTNTRKGTDTPQAKRPPRP